MKYIYALPLLLMMAACSNGAIFGDDDSSVKTVEEVKNLPVLYQNKPYKEATSQQIYTVLASRSINKMLKDTSEKYSGGKLPTIYVLEPKQQGSVVVPDNVEYATKVTKDILQGTKKYILADSELKADYVLETIISRNPIPARNTSIIVYKTIMKDNRKNEVGTWVETLSPIMNDDQSWW